MQITLYLGPKQAVYHEIIGNNAKRTTGLMFGIDDLGEATLDFFYRRAYQGDELLASLGQSQAARGAMQQLNAQLMLHFADDLAQ